MTRWRRRRRAGQRLLVAIVAGALLTTACAEGATDEGATEEGRPDGQPIALHLELLDPDDLDTLYEHPAADDRMPATVRVEDGREVAADARLRGNTARFHPKKSFNVRVDEPVPGLGTGRLNLNAMWTDPSMLREHLVWEAFARIDRPASATAYVDLYLDGAFEGLYLQVQRVDQELLADHGLEATSATLIRDRTRQVDGVWSVFGAELPDDDAELRTWVQDRFDTRGEADWTAIADLVRWVQDTPAGDAFADGFAERFDVEVFVDWLAVTVISTDLDSYGDDYWLHLDHRDPDGRWTVLPWDHDLTFGSHYLAGFSTANHLFRYGFPIPTNARSNPLVEQFLETPSLRAKLETRLIELLDDELSVAWFHTMIDDVAERIRPSQLPVSDDAFVRHPANHFSDPDDLDRHVEAVRDAVELRTAFLRTQVAAADTPDVADVAELDLRELEVGDRVLLTDATGWTIAALDLHEVADPGVVRVTVDRSELSDAVDRVWTFEHDGGAIDAEVTLYVRHHPERCGMPICEDWVDPASGQIQAPDDTAGDGRQDADAYDPIAAKAQLRLAEVVDGRPGDPLSSEANPYSDKVTARTVLEGPTQLVLVRP